MEGWGLGGGGGGARGAGVERGEGLERLEGVGGGGIMGQYEHSCISNSLWSKCYLKNVV